MDGRIQVLPREISEKIAAGEVIERPASVVKELVENSLDAGAKRVAVILEDGGKALIEVTDDGQGMGPDDLAIAVKRHATSKIRELSDLERLSSLGFRGEALPSVSAASDLSILSRAAGSDSSAYEFISAAETVKPVAFGHFLGSPHGTRVRAQSLFSQIPARLKFLKSAGAEVSQTREWLERLAMTHPEVSFRLVSGDRTVLNLVEQSESERVRAILADGDDAPIVTVSDARGARLHWIQGSSLPQMRKIIQVVNGRAIRDRLLQQALLGAFRQALMPGQFPALALFLEVDPAEIDVNVHPTKTEVRFLHSKNVFAQVQELARRMIETHGAIGHVGAQSTPAWERPFPEKASPPEPDQGPRSFSFQTPLWHASEPDSAPATSTAAPAKPHGFTWTNFRGIVFNTYLIYDFGEELALIDQHAAHERVRYEKLRKRAFGGPDGQAPSQQLLIPEAVHFSEDLKAVLEERARLLTRLGFEAETFGETSMLFRAIPAEWGTDDLRTRLKNLVSRLAEHQGSEQALAFDEALFERLASEACHSAIRAGDRISDEAARALTDQLLECEHPWNCPHGRPTIVRVPQSRFEEWFQRRT